MTGLFTAQTMTVCRHIFVYIFVTYIGLFISNSLLIKGLVQTNIGHDGGNDCIGIQFAIFFHVFTAYVQNQVTIYHIAIFIHCQTTVCITIISKTYIQLIVFYELLQHFNMCGTTVHIDVGTVGFVIDYIGFRSQCIKNALCHGPCTAVGAIQTYTHSFKRTGCQTDQITHITISAHHIVCRTSNRILYREGNFSHGAIQICLNFFNHILRHLFTVTVQQLDSIVVVRIVAGGNHDTAVKIFSSYHIGNAGSCGYMQQICICTGSSQTSCQRIFKHIAASSGIFTDYHLAFMLLAEIPAQETSYFICMFYC